MEIVDLDLDCVLGGARRNTLSRYMLSAAKAAEENR
jgi:hypothetical protein